MAATQGRFCRADEVHIGSWENRTDEDPIPAPFCNSSTHGPVTDHRSHSWSCEPVVDVSGDVRLQRDVRGGTNRSTWALFVVAADKHCQRYRELGIGPKLVWRSSRCQLHRWDASSFCTKLGARRLLFVGDSTMLQMFALLVNEVQWGLRNANWSEAQMLNCTSRLLFGPADTPDLLPYGGLWYRGRPWNEWVLRTNLKAGDVVVLSFGAHVYGQSNFMHLLKKVASERRALANRARGVHFVWKSQAAAGCNSAKEGARTTPPDQAFWRSHPMVMPPAKRFVCHDHHLRFDAYYRDVMGHNNTEAVCYASQLDKLSSSETSVYNWPEFESRDTLAEAFWSSPSHRVTGLPMPALLNLRASHLRPDAHGASASLTGADPECRARGEFCYGASRAHEFCRCAKDCLHTCQPGPIDRLAPQLLHHMLQVGEI